VHNTPSVRQRASLWARLAVLLSFFAVFSALVAPASMLAEEVRTGKLGGLCAISTAVFTAASDGGSSTDSGATHAGSHCELCGSMGMVLPPLPVADVACLPGSPVLAFEARTVFSAAVPGLPFSRGPPAFLS
jgi:hypothetical protein